MKYKLIVLCVTVLFVSNILFAENLGGFSNSEFRYGSNAREFALAGALVAESNLGFRQFSNPALLALIEAPEVGLSLFNMSLDRSIQTFTYSRHLPPKAGAGISIYRIGVDNIIGRNTIGETTGLYNNSDIMGILTFGVQFNKKLAIGLNMKILHSNTGVKDFLDKNIGSNGVGIDLGIIYQINNEINIGFRIQNIINKSKWKYSLYKDLSVIEESYSINSPKVVTVGAKYDILEKLLFLLQVDVSLIPIIKNPSGRYELGIVRSENDKILWRIPEDGYIIRMGIEKEFENDFILRAGLHQANPVIGFGIKISVWKDYNIIWDYAVDPGVNKEGTSHNFSWRIEI